MHHRPIAQVAQLTQVGFLVLRPAVREQRGHQRARIERIFESLQRIAHRFQRPSLQTFGHEAAGGEDPGGFVRQHGIAALHGFAKTLQ